MEAGMIRLWFRLILWACCSIVVVLAMIIFLPLLLLIFLCLPLLFLL
jgi:hypothetical protein